MQLELERTERARARSDDEALTQRIL